MTRRPVLALILLFVPLCFVIADVDVDYVEGDAQMRDGSRWVDLFIGDVVPTESAIKLGTGGYAELSDGSSVIKLSRPGTYEISEIASGSQRTARAGIGGLVLGRIGRLTGQEQAEQQTAAGGARASEAVSSNQMQWAGSLESLIEEGVGFLAEGFYQDAYWTFEDAYGGAIDSEMPELAFYLGYSSLMMGEVIEAANWLEEYGPDNQTTYYAVHVLALGQLLLEGFAYQEAIDQLSPVASLESMHAEDRQSAQLMLGIAYSGLGMTSQARDYLRQAQRTAPETEAAQTAGSLLSQL